MQYNIGSAAEPETSLKAYCLVLLPNMDSWLREMFEAALHLYVTGLAAMAHRV